MINEWQIFSGRWSWVWIIGGWAVILWYLYNNTTFFSRL